MSQDLRIRKSFWSISAGSEPSHEFVNLSASLNRELYAMRCALAVPRQHVLPNRLQDAGSRLRCQATAGSEARGIFDVVGHGSSNVTVFDAR